MKLKKNIRPVLITCCVILLALAGIAAITGRWNVGKNRIEKEKNESANVMDETNIGLPIGDDPWQEMEKLVKGYYGGEQGIRYSGVMQLMDDNGIAQTLIEKQNFEYSFLKGQYYYKLGQIECVGKEKFFLLVNHEDKTLALSSIIPAGKNKEDVPGMADFRNVLEKRSAGIKITQLGTEKILTVNNIEDPGIQGYQVFYDPLSYRIHKLVIGMIRFSPLEEEPAAVTEEDNTGDEKDGYSYMLEIRYEKANPLSMSEKEFQPEKKFIRIRDKKIELMPEYSSYSLLN